MVIDVGKIDNAMVIDVGKIALMIYWLYMYVAPMWTTLICIYYTRWKITNVLLLLLY